ncbi:lactase/phlorizin hydrolase-like [Cydia amplana]|uniref:lactase/phlorizin hydrolase-like n=1 Tax=Cydia amplana TaxID=1869771 RepID=UPI002FE6A8F2
MYDDFIRPYLIFSLSAVLLVLAESKSAGSRQEPRKFPDGFLFGTATASYQIEGAWDEDGKSENIWDHLTHTNPCATKDCSNGDIADDTYHLYKRDVEMMRELGIDYYRFSLSWTRLMPTSFPDQINPAGVEFYNNYINEMLKYNITPMITLYHWDLPQKLQEMGGWTNPSIVDWFADYARTAFELFGDRVKFWITFNEPHVFCYYGYGDVSMAPQLNIKGVAEYLCSKNMLMSHAKTWHMYDEEYRSKQSGTVSITLSSTWYEPEDENNPEHIQAAEDANQFDWGQYAHPIFSENGGYPQEMVDNIAAKSAAQGYSKSRLPEFTEEEKAYVRGTSDYFGLNHYYSRLTYRNETAYGYHATPSFWDDINAITYVSEDWKIGASDYVKYTPWGFYKILTKIRKDYNNPPVYITENGFATLGGLEDEDRVQYYRGYLDAMLDAIDEGSDVRGYTAWSIMDNFEWMQGYIERFGLYEVDYTDPARPRTPRKSAFVYKEIVRSRTLDPHYEPTATVMTIDEGHCKMWKGVLLSTVLLVLAESKSAGSRYEPRKVPDGFLFGTATASYQIEGAWDEDGKSENIWDHLTHTDPCAIKDCSNGDIAADSYHLYKRDVEMMRELGIDYYRFSLSWTRLMPTSFPDHINPAGVEFYNNYINEMLKYNITPMITLYHWDLPQKLQEMGGWTNPNIVDWFADYSRTAFELFGDRVKFWITFNEPHATCRLGYGDVTMAPRLNIKGVAEYLCSKNILLSHARAWHMYDEQYRLKQRGTVSITFSSTWYEPEDENNHEHIQAAEDANQFDWGQYAHPIFSENGGYPQEMVQNIAAKSALQGYPKSRLPAFTEEEKAYVRGTSDYFGLNHYSSKLTYRNESVHGYHATPSFWDDINAITYTLEDWEFGASGFVKYTPWGFYKILTKIRKDYNNPPVYITENGFATLGGLEDEDRVQYYRGYLDAMLDAIDEGSDVRGYTAWSIMDNFEWMQGYIERFGLYEVDYTDPARPRTPRRSAFVYKEIVRSRTLDPHYEPTATVMTIDEGH